VLYAPSWDEGLSLRTSGEEVIENILKINNINLIVKLHPISYCPQDGPNYMFYTGGVNWKERLSKFETNKNFRHVPTNNIDPILSASDLMVTDVSSVALEFIMLDKPVIYIDCPEFFEKTLKKTYANFGDTTADFVRNDPKANAGRHVGKVVYDIGKLCGEIQKSLENPGEHSELRKEFAKQLSYNPGNAANAAAEQILKILTL
jgi:CDP-glycerol glycerophosphotransferase (TagB/SpsB family)